MSDHQNTCEVLLYKMIRQKHQCNYYVYNNNQLSLFWLTLYPNLTYILRGFCLVCIWLVFSIRWTTFVYQCLTRELKLLDGIAASSNSQIFNVYFQQCHALFNGPPNAQRINLCYHVIGPTHFTRASASACKRLQITLLWLHALWNILHCNPVGYFAKY